jgi:hypothetical protein
MKKKIWIYILLLVLLAVYILKLDERIIDLVFH